MTRTLVTAIVLLAILFGVPCPAAAQEPVKSFDQLDTRLKPGDTVWVTDAQGREIKGRIRELGSSSLVLDDGTARTLAAGDVRSIREQKADSLTNGAFIGLVAGAFGGAAVGAGLNGALEGDSIGLVAVWMGVGAGAGAGLGALIDYMIPGRTLVVFRAPAPAGPSSARLSFAPVITPRAKGVVVAFSF